MPPWIDPLQKTLVVDVTKCITVNPSPSSSKFSSTPGSFPPASLPALYSPHIYPAIIASLRVIWVRHADPAAECIIHDLCTRRPQRPCQGVLSPLEMYHDESARISEDGNRGEGTPRGRELGAGLGSTFDMGWGVGLGLSLLLPRIAIIASIKIKYEIRMGIGTGC
jgi:hypothetical protein